MGMSREAAARPHPPTWVWGGALIAVSALPVLVQALGFVGLPIDWSVFAVIAQPIVLLFPLGLAFLAIGLRQDDSVVERVPLGVAALFVVGLTDVLLMVPALGGLLFTLTVLQGAAAFIAIMLISRTGVVPPILRRLGLTAFIVSAFTFAAAAILPVFFRGESASIVLSWWALQPLDVLSALAQLAVGIALIAVPRRAAPTR